MLGTEKGRVEDAIPQTCFVDPSGGERYSTGQRRDSECWTRVRIRILGAAADPTPTM
jgi:hypothetical protein